MCFNSFNYFSISTNSASQIILSERHTTKPKAQKIHCRGIMELFSVRMKILNLQDGMSLIHCFFILLIKLEMGTEENQHRDTAV